MINKEEQLVIGELRSSMQEVLHHTQRACLSVDDPKQVSEALKEIRNTGEYMLSVLNHMADRYGVPVGAMSRTVSRGAAAEPEMYRRKAFIRHIQETFLPLCEKKRIHFIYQEENAEPAFLVDKNSFNQVCHQTIVKTLEHTPEGGKIKMTLRFDPEQEKVRAMENRSLRCSIILESDGNGLQDILNELEEVQTVLFHMRGSIHVHSKIGRGAEIKIELPVEAAEEGYEPIPVISARKRWNREYYEPQVSEI